MFTANFKCQYCPRSFSSRNAYAQHVNLCIVKYDISTEESNESNESNNEVSEIISEATDMAVDSEDNENSEDSEYSETSEDSENSENGEDSEDSERQEEMASSSEMRENPQDLQEYDGDVSLISLSILERYENLPASLRSFEEEPEIKNVKEFPNEAYADLMTLVTKHNLNNQTGNEIINFFNKHSNLSISPLPKNILAGRKFMDDMDLSHLANYKHCILVHNDNEYFIHYYPVKNCIENLLSNPDITEHFAYDYEDLAVKF